VEHSLATLVLLLLLVGCGWRSESNWNLIWSKRLKAKTYVKWRVLYRYMSGLVVVVLQNMQVLIPLFFRLWHICREHEPRLCLLPLSGH
jgi:hypothetical protein